MAITKIADSIELEFGSGDIEVMPGLLQTDSVIGVVCFMQKEPAPIGIRTDYTPNKVTEIEETPVRMIFNKIESIDVVIRSLKEAKQYMINGSLV